MKIYTRTGDDGSTGLYGGERVAKHDPRVHAYGVVDEANAALGLARAWLDEAGGDLDELVTLIDRVQNTLFDLGADLATPLTSRYRKRLVVIGDDDVADLEHAIDRFESELEPLANFILPAGHPAAAALHLARTVVRRAERETVGLEPATVNPVAAVYLNRLSDLLFVLARVANRRTGRGDLAWRKREPSG